MEGAVGADGYSCGYRGAGDVVCCSRVEFLWWYVRYLFSEWSFFKREREGGRGRREGGLLTLQKSILLTPLEPSAGPTGGEGDAWPAPTMSLTIWSF